MKPHNVIYSEHPEKILFDVLGQLHQYGPVDQEYLETLAYLKYYHPKIFSKEESKLMYLLGLFYKIDEPKDTLSLAYSIYSGAIHDETGIDFTPVQASIRNHIIQNRYFSFSAPTSAGKSFLLRELIIDQLGDIVIVVPSRALIAEYIYAVRKMVLNQKNILVLQFIDDVNKKRTNRKIFIVTPERATEIFKEPQRYNVSLFLYDEAQISEEKTRGVSFDALVRRADKIYPEAKKVFAHPFVTNPEAQFKKHNIRDGESHMVYRQNAVGKIYLTYNKARNTFKCFSPFIKDAHLKKNMVDINIDVAANILRSNGSILVYISKSSIYNKTYKTHFGPYIAMCGMLIDPAALSIIDEIKDLIGASGKQSDLVELMKRGVVIHHGSIPLSVRLLIEKYTNNGFARICFATSTLAQGVNMPFDLVWVENARFLGSDEHKTLGLKNLIGRAGRSTEIKNHFDYGFVVVKNVRSFVEMLNGEITISSSSKIDAEIQNESADYLEFIDAVKNETLNNEYNLPEVRLTRLKLDETKTTIQRSLDLLFSEGEIITGAKYQVLEKSDREQIKETFKLIYSLSLGRELVRGEQCVLSRAVSILLWYIQGKSFRELLGLRYSYLTHRDEQRNLRRRLKENEITEQQFKEELKKLKIAYSPIAMTLPNSKAIKAPVSLFRKESVVNFNYDLLVYDTYDYLDKVISFSLSDIYSAAFAIYYENTKDVRAKAMVNYFRYGTNDTKEIWLLRYGYSFEDIEWLNQYVVDINENEIVFEPTVKHLVGEKLQRVERYLY